LKIAKAFLTVNRFGLLVKLLQRNCPVSVDLLSDWLFRSTSCVR
jgi:hypothetical protein